ncbi:MAG: hypothetical protein M0O97_06695 [Arcobacteraceae bacterium]|nr:hypothetical protein [Arcobacteraceae bacterium]
MTLYKTTITPISNFATSLKGDTLFGQMCWAIRYTLGEAKLEELLSSYDESPFLIVSDGFAKNHLPKPTLPSYLLNENLENKKENRKKIWLSLSDLQNLNFINAKTDLEINNIKNRSLVVKNSINYKTFMTDNSGVFAPYSEEEISLSKTDIYFLLDKTKFSLEELQKSFLTLSKIGYGKNSSIGKGFFEFEEFKEVKIENISTNIFMTLSPSSLENQDLKECFYEPFTRFGKHGAMLSNSNPFKKPILLANTGSVVMFERKENKQYIGKSIKGHSSFDKTVHQGYSILIPIKELNFENI